MRRIAFLTRCLFFLAAFAGTFARAGDNEVREASLRAIEEGIVLDADFSFELTPRLAEALANGVALYFVVDFELGRSRWYWLDEKAASGQLQMRLSHHPLSRQYRLSTGILQRNFALLEEALDAVKHVRNWLVVDRTVSFSDADYEAAVRLRIDSSLLPKPFQLSALTSRELQLETPWKKFVVRSPRHAPAPVESREPRRQDREGGAR